MSVQKWERTNNTRRRSVSPGGHSKEHQRRHPGRQAASGALVADSALEQRPHEQSSDGTPLPAWHLCWRWRRPGDRWVMGGDRIRAAPECVDASRRFVSSGQSPVPSLFNPLSKLLLQSYQSSQQLSYCDPGVRTVPIMTAQFLKIFFKKTFY